MEDDIHGRVCAVTGANTGIGKATAEGLARLGARVILICRSQSRGRKARAEIEKSTGNDQLEVVEIDLGSMASIRAGARAIRERYEHLHVLVNNASVIVNRREETSEGNEVQLAVNHLGYFLLTHELLGLLEASAPARVVNVAGDAHHMAALDLDDLQWKRRRYWGFRVYATTLLLEILFTHELARRLEGTGVTATALHPGVVDTELMRNWPRWMLPLWSLARPLLLSPEAGARTPVFLASSPEVEGVSGEYFYKCRPRKTSRIAHDRELARRVWAVSEKLCGLSGSGAL
jgi:NAD(P)-dependent dehydrogenase (short-subunit alcohol dehydrogenase family)